MKNILSYKQIAGLVLAICVSVLIIIFHDQINKLQGLGYVGVFLIMLLSNATLFLPAPSIVFNFTLGGTLPNPLLVGLAAGLGSTFGEMTGYIAGYSGSGVVNDSEAYKYVKRLLNKYGIFMIFLLALIPNPVFDVVGILSGALGIPWWKFLLATGIGKIIRAIAVAYLGVLFLHWNPFS